MSEPRASGLRSGKRLHPELRVLTHNTNDNHLLYMLRPLASANPFATR